jgi:hypothetical protein
MTLSNTTSNGSFEAQLEQERRALWQAHPNWSEETLQHAWSKRLMGLVTELATRVNDAAVPRNLQYGLGGIGTSPAQVQGADQGRLVGGFLLMDSGRG